MSHEVNTGNRNDMFDPHPCGPLPGNGELGDRPFRRNRSNRMFRSQIETLYF